MRKILLIVLSVVLAFTCALSAWANPNGGIPRSHTFPVGMTPAETLQYFHHKITDGEPGLAWDILTEDYKNAFRSYENFRDGYRTTLSSRPSNIRQLQRDANTMEVFYLLNAEDRENDQQILVQTFECSAIMKRIDGCWRIDSGTGKLLSRTVLGSRETARAILMDYHECITNKEMRRAWSFLGDRYKKAFGDFAAFCKGFDTTVSSVISDAVPVADGPDMVTFEYTLTAKDSTPETNIEQVFKGGANLEVVPGRGWVIMSAENKLVNRYFPPKW